MSPAQGGTASSGIDTAPAWSALVTLIVRVDIDHKLSAVDAQSGLRIWQYSPHWRTVNSFNTIEDSILVRGATVYATTKEFQTGLRCLHAIDVRTGQERWAVPGYSSIIAAGSLVYGRDAQGLTALEAATGHSRWHVQIQQYRGCAKGPWVDDGTVLVADEQCVLHAYTALTGAALWQFRPGYGPPSSIGSPRQLWSQDGLINVFYENDAADATLFALDPRSGTPTWHYGKPRGEGLQVQGHTGHRIDIMEEKLISGATDADNHIRAVIRLLDARTGTVRWSKSFLASSDGAGLFVSPDQVIIEAFRAAAAPTQLSAYDALTGKPLWDATIPGTVSFADREEVAALAGGVLVSLSPTPTHKTQVRGLDAATGLPRWTTLLAGGSNILNIETNMIFLHTYGERGRPDRVVALDIASGKLRWQATGDGPTIPLETPADSAPPTLPADVLYIPQTEHSVPLPFVSAYQTLFHQQVLGYPVTEAYRNQGVLTQDFEHLRLELRGKRVIIAPLGSDSCRLHCPPADVAAVTPTTDTATRRYFPDTGHTLQGDFLRYWQGHGGQAVLGAPVSEVFSSTNGDGSDRMYTMQYFQNARLERHPEVHDSRYAVQLGSLGRVSLVDRGWR